MTVQRNLRARHGLQARHGVHPTPSRASTSLHTVHLLVRAAGNDAPSTLNLQLLYLSGSVRCVARAIRMA